MDMVMEVDAIPMQILETNVVDKDTSLNLQLGFGPNPVAGPEAEQLKAVVILESGSTTPVPDSSDTTIQVKSTDPDCEKEKSNMACIVPVPVPAVTLRGYKLYDKGIRLGINKEERKIPNHPLLDVHFEFNLETGKKIIGAHRSILLDGPGYTFFRNIIQNSTNPTGTVNIIVPSEIDVTSTDQLLDYIYGTDVKDLELNEGNLDDFLKACVYFEMDVELLTSLLPLFEPQHFGSYIKENIERLSKLKEFWELDNQDLVKLSIGGLESGVLDAYFIDWILNNKNDRQECISKLMELVQIANSDSQVQHKDIQLLRHKNIPREAKLIYNQQRKTNEKIGLHDVQFNLHEEQGGHKIMAHKFILDDQEVCGLFHRLMIESGPLVIAVDKSVSFEAAEAILDFLYGMSINELGFESENTKLNLDEFLDAACFFEMDINLIVKELLTIFQPKDFEKYISENFEKLSTNSGFWNLDNGIIVKLCSVVTSESLEDALLIFIQANKRISKRYVKKLVALRKLKEFGIGDQEIHESECQLNGSCNEDTKLTLESRNDLNTPMRTHSRKRSAPKHYSLDVESTDETTIKLKFVKAKKLKRVSHVDENFAEAFEKARDYLDKTLPFDEEFLEQWNYFASQTRGGNKGRFRDKNCERFISGGGMSLLFESLSLYEDSEMRGKIFEIIEDFIDVHDFSFVTDELIEFLLIELDKSPEYFYNFVCAGEILSHYLVLWGEDKWKLDVSRTALSKRIISAVTKWDSYALIGSSSFISAKQLDVMISFIKSNDFAASVFGLWAICHNTSNDTNGENDLDIESILNSTGCMDIIQEIASDGKTEDIKKIFAQKLLAKMEIEVGIIDSDEDE